MKMNIMMAVRIGLAAAGLTAGITLAGCGGGSSFDINDYVVIDQEAYNGYGSVELKGEQLVADVYEKMAKKGTVSADSYGMGYLGADMVLAEAIRGDFVFPDGVTNGHLSNGDTFTASFEVNNDLLKPYKIRITAKEKKYKISGLKEVETFDAFKQISVSFEGTNGVGKANITANNTEGLEYTVEPQSNLSNGDIVTVTVEDYYSGDRFDDYIREHGVIPAETTKTYTVEGLPEIETFDPFEGVELVFSGVEPEGKAEIVQTDNNPYGLSFKYENTGLSNGDVITVTAYAYGGWFGEYKDFDETFIEEHGAKPAYVTKDFVVEGLGKYIQSIDDISPEMKDFMFQHCEDKIESYYAQMDSEYDYDYYDAQRTFLGAYVRNRKPTGRGSDQNYIDFIYRIDESSDIVPFYNAKELTHADMTYYHVFSFKNAIGLPDGTTNMDVNHIKDNLQWNLGDHTCKFDINGTRISRYGYKTLTEVYNDYVSANIDNYSLTENTVEDL